ncbi:MAG: hypothetical protein ACKO3H_11100, partial [Verrucomicrobiota bacterium]
MDSPQDTVMQRVRETARRLRLRRGWESAWTGSTWGLALLIAGVGIHKVVPLSQPLLVGIASLPGIGAGVGFLLGAAKAIRPDAAARWLDARLGLHERIATALEIPSQGPVEAWHLLVVRDAAARCRDGEIRHLIPLRLPPNARWTALLATMLGALLLVPAYRPPERVQARQEAEAVRSAGRHLSEVTRKTLEESRRLAEPIRKELEQLEALGDRLQQASLTRDEALKEVSRASDRLREQGLDLARNPTLQRLGKAARAGGPDTGRPRTDGRESGPNPGAADVESLRQQLDSLQKAAREAAEGMKSGTGPDRHSDLATAAEQVLDAARELGLDLPALGKALQDLRDLQVDRFLKDLENASRDLGELAERARRQEGAEAGQVGRDLGQQLERGQIDAAIASLERLERLVEETRPGESGRAAGAEELRNAIPSAEGYGEVARHLQRALERSNGRDPAEARKELSDARKALEALRADLQDLQSLRSAMTALGKARQGLSGASAEGGGKGAGGRSRGRGRGGFGDWAEDDPWRLPEEIAESWDNSGLSRADTASRGISDRSTSRPE